QNQIKRFIGLERAEITGQKPGIGISLPADFDQFRHEIDSRVAAGEPPLFEVRKKVAEATADVEHTAKPLHGYQARQCLEPLALLPLVPSQRTRVMTKASQPFGVTLLIGFTVRRVHGATPRLVPRSTRTDCS